jgi:hypothetical protein
MAAIASYAVVVSTLSLVLAIRAHRAGEPNFNLGWEYNMDGQQLSVMMTNRGRSDISIYDLELSIVRHEITRQIGKVFDFREILIREVPLNEWRANSAEVSFPFRLTSFSIASVRARNEALRPLAPDHPFDELLLKFVARSPKGKQAVFMRGEILRHFIARNPDWRIFSSPSSIELD